MKNFIAVLFSLLFLAHATLYAKTTITEKVKLGLNARVSEDLTLGFWGAGYFGDILDQTSLWLEPKFSDDGMSIVEYSPRAELHIGKVGNLTIDGTGELLFRRRSVDVFDTTLNDAAGADTSGGGKYSEVRPRGGVNISMPVARWLILHVNNMFERRFTKVKPDKTLEEGDVWWFSPWRWRTHVEMSTIPLSPVKVAFRVWYEGYHVKPEVEYDYMSEVGFGVNLSPVDGLHIGLSDRIQWIHVARGTVTHLIGLNVHYTFNLAQ